MNDRDKRLGMHAGIMRRDFLNGVSVAVGASLLPGAANADLRGRQDQLSLSSRFCVRRVVVQDVDAAAEGAGRLPSAIA